MNIKDAEEDEGGEQSICWLHERPLWLDLPKKIAAAVGAQEAYRVATQLMCTVETPLRRDPSIDVGQVRISVVERDFLRDQTFRRKCRGRRRHVRRLRATLSALADIGFCAVDERVVTLLGYKDVALQISTTPCPRCIDPGIDSLTALIISNTSTEAERRSWVGV
jgi:hypothetical protein